MAVQMPIDGTVAKRERQTNDWGVMGAGHRTGTFERTSLKHRMQRILQKMSLKNMFVLFATIGHRQSDTILWVCQLCHCCPSGSAFPEARVMMYQITKHAALESFPGLLWLPHKARRVLWIRSNHPNCSNRFAWLCVF